MEEPLQISLELMRETDIEEAVGVICNSMDENEAGWAKRTMELCFACGKYGIDSGREYYIWRYDRQICGLVGLHRYVWGPEENVWLSWFAVRPDYQRMGAGSALMDTIQEQAVKAGYKKLFIETYEHPTFEKAHLFYRSKGFRQVGRVENYLSDGSAMLVFGKQIAE
jgi:GNAT superfamily N-acetyltransferase